MKPTYTFRTALLADLSAIQALGIVAYGQFQEVLSAEHWQQMKGNFSNVNKMEEVLTTAQGFVCEVENQLVGMVFLYAKGNPTALFDKDWSYIRLLGVHPAFSGQGIGRKLMELCIEHAQKTGEHVVALHTSEFQDAGRHLYENMGFEKVKELDLIYGKRFWVYQLELNPVNDPITFHRVTQPDIPALVEHRIAFALELAGPQPTEAIKTITRQLTTYFSEEIPKNTCISFMAKCKGETAGIGSVQIREFPGNFSNPSGKWGYIMNMYTVPKFRRKGICATILNALVKAGAEIGVMSYELHATEAGAYVYEQNGFILHPEPTYRKHLSILKSPIK